MSYGIQTQHWFIPDANELPFTFWSVCMALIAIWVLLVVSAGPMKELLRSTIMSADEADELSMAPRAWRTIWFALLNILAFGCVYALGWFTQATGGVLSSPYSFALAAIFAGSIFIARRWWVPIVVLAWTLAVSIMFSDWSDTAESFTIPKWLLFVTFIVNAIITLLVWLFRVWYHRWVEEKLLSFPSNGAD
ncbi:hypothetical protein LQ938_11480 [Microbacterium sp. cx-55]|uniref:hypothetical protein n=1 Tax=Microbacterium sp. cx-55 TaxID=2875948 RepID=UPI001CC15970|nr:hypothetical protein [Microbacterium sp. cx-55]MBZ4488103.1 hypothetical protein [Microbacterium sp. cx-55]UGB34488.1 hypothetical protein LQ938_11480 [Microbacterium sp. cx-55]